jgi:hypothetical protein
MLGSTGKRTQEKRLGEYATEIRRTQGWRKDQGYDALWGKLREMYQGELNVANLDASEDAIAVNMAFSTINVMFPSVSQGQPNVEVRANDPSNEPQAVLVEEILNFAWDHWHFQPQFRMAAKDFLMFGHGWVKVGWNFTDEEQETSDEEREVEFDTLSAQADEAAVTDPANASALPTNEDIFANLSTTKTVTVEDQPFVDHVSILDILVNPEATSMHDLRWIAQRVRRPLEEAKRDENYASGARGKLSGAHSTFDTATDPRTDGNLVAERGKMVEIWEFYDLVDAVMAVFTLEDGKNFLVKPTKMPFLFGHPFVQMRNYDIPDMFYPMGDLEQLWPLQQELNKTRSDMMNFRAAYARKYLVRAGALQRGDVEKLISKTDGEIIQVENDNVNLEDIVVPVPINNLDPGLFNWSHQITSDIQEVSGVSEYTRGGGGGRRTATEAALIQDAMNARSGEKLMIVEQTASEVMRKVLQVMQQFLTGPQVARTFGADGSQKWLPYDRESIRGEFDFSVEAGSTQPNNETFRRQNAIALMNVMMPFVDGGIIDPQELAKHILSEGFSIRTPEKFFQQEAPQPQPGQPPRNPGTLPGAQGLYTPQPTAAEAQDEEQQSAIQGVPPELMNQLMNQNGVSPMV